MSSDGFSGVKNCHQEPKATLFVSLCGHNWIWGRTGGTLPRGEGDHIWFLALVCPTFSKLFLKASNYRKKYFTLTSKDRLFICSIWTLESLNKTFSRKNSFFMSLWAYFVSLCGFKARLTLQKCSGCLRDLFTLKNTWELTRRRRWSSPPYCWPPTGFQIKP